MFLSFMFYLFQICITVSFGITGPVTVISSLILHTRYIHMYVSIMTHVILTLNCVNITPLQMRKQMLHSLNRQNILNTIKIHLSTNLHDNDIIF